MLKLVKTTDADLSGFWGPPSSSVDWCETNYQVSAFIAEFANTLSSLSMVGAGLAGLLLHPWAEKRFHFAFASIVLLGLGSVTFHGTLWKICQAADEVPMIYTVLTFAYIMIVQNYSLSQSSQKSLAIGLSLYAILLTGLVTLFDGPLQFALFHISFNSAHAYSLFEVWRIYRARVLELADSKKNRSRGGDSPKMGGIQTKIGHREMESDESRRLLLRGPSSSKSIFKASESSSSSSSSSTSKDPIIYTFHRGAFFYGIAVTCWLTDMLLCEWVNPVHGTSVLPYNPQLHAWWHVFISCGLYYISTLVLLHRVQFLGGGPGSARLGLLGGWIPYVIRVKGSPSLLSGPR